MLRVLTIDEVRGLFDLMVEMSDVGELSRPMGAWTTASTALWSSALHALHPIYGHDAFPTLEMKAARVLLGGCVLSHPLTDGNKRLAAFAMHRQLMVNGFDLATSDDDLTHVVLSTIDAHQAGVEADRLVEIVADWIAERIVPLPAPDA